MDVRLRRALAIAAVIGAASLTRLPASPAAPAPARPDAPVATNDALYTALGRVFPDPHAFWPSPTQLPGHSPFAKGNAVGRAVTFISYDDAIAGLTYLEERYPDFVELYRLDEDFAHVLDPAQGDGFSAGLPTTTLDRAKSPLYLLRVTDERVPETAKKYFAVSLSIHGIERAGLEGGLRAAEDLATWGAETPEQPIMETIPDSLPAGEVLKQSSVFFLLANPDGWRRGDLTAAGPSFSRYNGNGVDLNRDWPAQGFTYTPYTPWSEPETRSFGKVLKHIRAKWDGGLDLHGQMNADSFSFTLLRSSQRPYDENQRMLQYVTGAWEDAEARLSWSNLIKPNDAPADDARMYGVKWGTTWDTIGYTNTGSISNWMDDELGLGADAISNEMSLSHISNCGTGNCFIPEVEQLHIDGNKSLIYGLVNYTLLPEDDTLRFTGRAAWLDHGQRLRPAKTGPRGPKGSAGVPDAIDFTLQHTGATSTYEFDVPSRMGGVRALVTYPNVQGVGTREQSSLYLDRYAADDPHADTDPDGWENVQSDRGGELQYAASGSQVDVVSPVPGKYRVRVDSQVAGPIEGRVEFTEELSWEDPGQRPYDASNMDFFAELAEHTAAPDQLTPLPAASVMGADLDPYDTVVAADRSFAFATTPAARAALGKRLAEFVRSGGNLILTDDAMKALEWMGLVPAESVLEGEVYAGYVQFVYDQEGEEVLTYDDPLAEGVARAGAAEGTGHRHQVTDPGPIGYAILTPEGNDAYVQPQWGVSRDAWESAGGRIAGMQVEDVTLGELKVGAGVVRVLGSLVPFPSNEFDVPHGVADYAVTYTGYELTRNLLSWDRPGDRAPLPQRPRTEPPAPRPQPLPGPGSLPATGGSETLLVLATAAAGAAVAGHRRRRRAFR